MTNPEQQQAQAQAQAQQQRQDDAERLTFIRHNLRRCVRRIREAQAATVAKAAKASKASTARRPASLHLDLDRVLISDLNHDLTFLLDWLESLDALEALEEHGPPKQRPHRWLHPSPSDTFYVWLSSHERDLIEHLRCVCASDGKPGTAKRIWRRYQAFLRSRYSIERRGPVGAVSIMRRRAASEATSATSSDQDQDQDQADIPATEATSEYQRQRYR
jgi:hypothetical protein